MQFDRLRRRDFIRLLGGVAAWPLAAGAQQPSNKPLHVGTAQVGPRGRPQMVAFEQRLRELGYVEGKNLSLEFINVEGQLDRYGDAMKELVRRNVDIVLAPGPEIALKSAVAATQTLPIVTIAMDYDVVAKGYVESLSRPGGNVTGAAALQLELTVKRLQLMKDAFPDMQGATVLWDRISADQWQVAQDAAARLGLKIFGIELGNAPYDYEAALAQAPPEHRGAIFTLSSPVFFPDRVRLAEIALHHRAASMFVFREYAEAGGLMSYGPSLPGMFRLAANYVDRIAKSAKPADLPIEQPTKFEFFINLKTAKSLGRAIPAGVLAIADEVIE
jgi:putative ABC transport system substrate-binding protein